MLFRLFLLFLIAPAVELWLLLRLAHAVGWLPMLAIVVLTAMLGAHLARREGILQLHRIQRSFAEGHDPAPELIEGLMILIAAILLITPGLMTDTFGFLLLIPVTRRPLRGLVQVWLKRHFVNRTFVHRAGPEPEEREVIDVTPESFDEDR